MPSIREIAERLIEIEKELADVQRLNVNGSLDDEVRRLETATQYWVTQGKERCRNLEVEDDEQDADQLELDTIWLLKQIRKLPSTVPASRLLREMKRAIMESILKEFSPPEEFITIGPRRLNI